MSNEPQVKKVIPLFEKKYPNAVAEFIFDQSSAHGAFAPDALNAKEMNVNPGGQKRHMHDTIIPNDNPNPALRGKIQQMSFPKDLTEGHAHYAFRGQQKGMRIILEERGLLNSISTDNLAKHILGECAGCKMSQRAREEASRQAAAAATSFFDPDSDNEDLPSFDATPPLPTSTTCCMRKVLSLQQDFLDEKPLLQLVIEQAGHKCYFLPKFHCELNPIEMYWGWIKIRKFSIHSITGHCLTGHKGMRNLADGTFPTAKRLVNELLDACPVNTIRAFFRKSWRYMDAYRFALFTFSLTISY